MKFSYFTRKERITYRVALGYKERVKASADKENLSISNWLAQCAIEFLDMPVEVKEALALEVANEAAEGTVMTSSMVSPPLLADIDVDVAALGWDSRTFWLHTAMHRKMKEYRFRKVQGKLAAFKILKQQENVT